MIFSINVMDWQQSVLDNSHSVSSDVWTQTIKMLDFLRIYDVQASFFIAPSVAEKYPVLIRKIKSAHHEIGCLFDTPYHKGSFQQRAQHAISTLEDTSDTKVLGIRHLNLSIADTDFDHYCSIVRKLGIQYDSSLITNKSICILEADYPSLGAFKAYGVSQYPLSQLLTLPFLSKPSLSFGGASFRLLPYEISYRLSKRLPRASSVFHMPIYDLDLKDTSRVQQTHDLHWNQKVDFWGRRSMPSKLQKLFGDYPFDNFKHYYFDG